MGTFEDQVTRLTAGEVEADDQEPTSPPPGPNAQVEGAAVIPDPPTAEPPQVGAPELSAEDGEPAPEVAQPDPLLQNMPVSVQKRINKAIRQREDAKREAEYWRAAALKDSASTPAPPPQPFYTPPFQRPKPSIEQFANDSDPYASLAYAAGEWAAEKKDFENQSRAYLQQQQSQMTAQQQAIISKMEEGVAKYPDFVEATDELGRIIPPAMREALFDSPAFPELAYHLAQNEDEVLRISKLTPLAQIRELGKLEDKLAVKTANPAAKQVRQPTPVETAGPGLPKVAPSAQKIFDAATKSGQFKDWVKYIEATER